MKIIPFYCDDYDDLFANTYLLVDKSNNCLIIDPSKEYFGIINYINKNNLNIKGILLTHGHYDHFRGAKILINNFNCSLYIGFEEIDFLTDPYLNCSSMMSAPYKLDIRPITVSEGETLKILDEDIICIHTPFHTIGSYCYYLNDSLINYYNQLNYYYY